MRRPAFQFYPNDWKSNAKLRRCSDAARGAWIDILCVLHGEDEYGVVRWPLGDLIRSAGVERKSVLELVDKGVLQGSDKGFEGFVRSPRTGNRDGDPVVLIEKTDKPVWFSSRMVWDEYVRKRRGGETRFSEENQPTNTIPMPSPEGREGGRRSRSPKGGIGSGRGDGPSSSSSTSPSGEGTPLPPFELARQAPPLVTLDAALAYAASGAVRMSPGAVRFWWLTRDAVGWRSGGVGSPRIVSWQSDMARSVDWAEDGAKKSRGKEGGDNFRASDVGV